MMLIIDGDIIAYKAAATSETPINWGDGLWTLHAHEEDVKKYVDDFIFTLKKDHRLGRGGEHFFMGEEGKLVPLHRRESGAFLTDEEQVAVTHQVPMAQ